jgi:hypothetical protein
MRYLYPYDQQIPPLGWQTTVVIVMAIVALSAYAAVRAIRRGK